MENTNVTHLHLGQDSIRNSAEAMARYGYQPAPATHCLARRNSNINSATASRLVSACISSMYVAQGTIELPHVVLLSRPTWRSQIAGHTQSYGVWTLIFHTDSNKIQLHCSPSGLQNTTLRELTLGFVRATTISTPF
jgi:hypothetical protein